MRAAVLLLLIPLLAGCLQSSDSSDRVGDAGFDCVADPMPIETEGGHDHANPDHHRFACNLRIVDHASLAEWGRSEEQPVGAHALDVHDDLLAVAVHGAETGEGQNGFHLFRVSEGTLRHLAFWDAGQEVNGDRTIVFSTDGTTVFLGFESGARPGVAAIDVTDPEHPIEVGFWADPTGFGPHTVEAGNIAGAEHVFLLSLGVTTLRYEDGEFTLQSRFATADEAGIADTLQYIDPSSSNPTGGAQTYALRSVYGHDMVFFDDDSRAFLLVAYAYDGAKIVDISNPQAPFVHVSWQPPADRGHPHYTHSAAAYRDGDGRFIWVVGSETFEPENQGIASPLWILDATDAVAALPKAVPAEHLSTWRNPGNAPAGNLGFSVHFFRIQDEMLYLSHYHGGVWVVDLVDPSDPVNAGYMMPVPEEVILPGDECCLGFDLDGVPMVFDVAVDAQGTVFAADLLQGVTSSRMV